jgi:hyperosmotically inducible protein
MMRAFVAHSTDRKNTMFPQFPRLLLASGIAVAIAAMSSGASAAPVSQDVTDARQETQIWTTYALSPYLRANDLKVSVHEGKATLSGKVEEGVDKDLAKQIALGVNGVETVDNQIVVQADYVPPVRSSGRSYGEEIDDATITAKVKSKLLWSTYTDGLGTEVDTKLGHVTLTGSADSAASKELAGRLASNTAGVVAVDNRLTVKSTKATVAESTKDPVQQESHVVSDSWISAKVKSTLMYSSNVDGSDIDVTTKKGIVTLSGKLDSGAERALAIELAKNVRGVASVESDGLTI